MSLLSHALRRSVRPSVAARRIAIAAAGILVTACTDDTTTMPRHADGKQQQFPATIDPSVYTPDYVPGSRKASEDAAIEAILARLPEKVRTRARADLNDRSVVIGGSTDPVIAQHLGVIASIRQADARARVEAARAKDAEAARDRIRVRVALVPSVRQAGARAVVLRKTDDGGVPLLLLPEPTVTTTDLARGLHAATVARKRYGARTSRNTSLVLREGRRVPVRAIDEHDQKSVALLAELRGRDPQTLPGVGTARVMDVLFRDTQGSRLR
jgi:hypothetical protein